MTTCSVENASSNLALGMSPWASTSVGQRRPQRVDGLLHGPPTGEQRQGAPPGGRDQRARARRGGRPRAAGSRRSGRCRTRSTSSADVSVGERAAHVESVASWPGEAQAVLDERWHGGRGEDGGDVGPQDLGQAPARLDRGAARRVDERPPGPEASTQATCSSPRRGQGDSSSTEMTGGEQGAVAAAPWCRRRCRYHRRGPSPRRRACPVPPGGAGGRRSGHRRGPGPARGRAPSSAVASAWAPVVPPPLGMPGPSASTGRSLRSASGRSAPSRRSATSATPSASPASSTASSGRAARATRAQTARRHLDPETGGHDVLDGVRLVEDDDVVIGQDGSAAGHVGGVEMGVHHHHVSGGRTRRGPIRRSRSCPTGSGRRRGTLVPTPTRPPTPGGWARSRARPDHPWPRCRPRR